jgi:hypothetical protein
MPSPLLASFFLLFMVIYHLTSSALAFVVHCRERRLEKVFSPP